MSYSDMPIRPLPPDVAAKVRSSVRITHLNQVVLELVKNALDADARSISIVVDFRRGGLVVEDDGFGIPSAEFEHGSGLAQAHNTSKADRQSAYGCQGLFLASLAAMSLLTITSRHRGQSQPNLITFHHSKVVSRLLPAPPHQAIRGSQGTKVTVNNLFGNMPVRLKYRASTLQRSEDLDKEWDELKRMLVALFFPNERLQRLRVSDSERARVMSIRMPPGSNETPPSNTARLQMIINQAGLVAPSRSDQWVHMSANTPELSIEAYVSLLPSPTKLNQFISIGNDPVFTTNNNANILYQEVNRIFAASDFGSNSTSIQADNSLPDLESRDFPSRSASRAGARWPMFYIRIGSNASWKLPVDDEKTIESDRTLQHIVSVLNAMLSQFLQQHHCRPPKKRRTQQNRQSPIESPVSSAKKQAMKEFRSFSSWSRVKSADAQAYGDLFKIQPMTTRFSLKEASSPKTHMDTKSSHFPSASSAPTPTERPNDTALGSSTSGVADLAISWTEPGTNDTVLVNSRTGQCLSTRQQSTRPRSTGVLSRTRRQSIPIRPKSAPARDQSIWLDSIMHDWESPVFPRPETPVLSTHCVSHDVNRASNFRRDINYGKNISKGSSKLPKGSLAQACVIGQVDRKFILIAIPLDDTHGAGINSQKTLVLVDQHAADERCRLEQLFSEMFTTERSQDGTTNASSIRTYEFSTPLQVDIEEEETHLFHAYSGFFASWGCHYQIVKTSGEKSSLLVGTLPIGIAERCRLEPTLLADLLRRETWSHAGERIPPTRSSQTTSRSSSSSPFPWLDSLAGCPETIIELLNSRACRSSIMFNDSLSRDECRNLVSRLSRCAFPFQCAHGRPSMIPIADDNSLSFPCHSVPPEETGFVDAFRKWTAGSSS